MLCDTRSNIAAARERGPDALVGIMARIMIDQEKTESCASEDSLRRAGFTRREIDTYAGRARDRAASRSAERETHDRERLDAELTAEIAAVGRLTSTIEGSIAQLKARIERMAGRVG